MRSTIYIICIFFLTGICFVSCSPRRLESEQAIAESSDPRIIEGRRVFKSKCQSCHPNGEAGVGPEINNIMVPKFVLKARVRSRGFLLWTGRMPQFDKHEISAKELKSLVRYIKVMQRNAREI
jgi:mono/diheme cytochrome c family protein